VAASHPIIVVGAGIGGLTTALALARRGFRVTVIEQAERLEETGAGIQLSPNATRVLLGLGLEQALKASAVAPQAVEIATVRGRPLARVPLGASAAQRYGAPYWVIHRGDLQTILADAARGETAIALELGTRFEGYTPNFQGVTVACSRGDERIDKAGTALIGADGLWSALRARIGHRAAPTFRRRTAWRALIPASEVEPALAAPIVRLWLNRNAHLVHYPVRAGMLINIVAIAGDRSPQPGWSRDGSPAEMMQAFAPDDWSDQPRALLAIPQRWQRWSLYDLAPLGSWGDGPVTLVGDAAHPMLPFLAQGAAMAIEDAAVLAAHLASDPDCPWDAMRRYEAARRRRIARVQHASRRNGGIYHLGGIAAAARDIYLRAANGNRLLHRNDWLYSWRPEPPS
jgi:salicylate hydroxylase